MPELQNPLFTGQAGLQLSCKLVEQLHKKGLLTVEEVVELIQATIEMAVAEQRDEIRKVFKSAFSPLADRF